MSDYRHNFHAGNLGDVLKHTILIEVAAIFKKDEFRYFETNSANYKFKLGDANEGWSRGVGKLKKLNPIPTSLFTKYQKINTSNMEYFSSWGMLREYWVDCSLEYCFILCDIDKEVVVDVQKQLKDLKEFNIQIDARDGFNYLNRLLDCDYYLDLVLIDHVVRTKSDFDYIYPTIEKLLDKKCKFLVWYNNLKLFSEIKTKEEINFIELTDNCCNSNQGTNMKHTGMLFGNIDCSLVKSVFRNTKYLGKVKGWTVSMKE